MSHFSDEQLGVLMAEVESDRVERKQSFQGDAPQKVREAVCALANDLAGHEKPGVVFIGACDDGTPMPGFVVTDELLRSLADIKADGNTVPPPSLLVEKRVLSGSEVAVITAWPCDTPPVRYKGRIHVRWAPGAAWHRRKMSASSTNEGGIRIGHSTSSPFVRRS